MSVGQSASRGREQPSTRTFHLFMGGVLVNFLLFLDCNDDHSS